MNIKNKKHFTTKEFAEILNISRQAVFKKIKKGQIKAERVGKIYIIPKESLGGIYNELTDKTKKDIEKGVKKVTKEYGEALRMLSKE